MPLRPDTLLYTNAAGNDYSVQRLQFYFSDLQLLVQTGQPKTRSPVAPAAHVPGYALAYHYCDFRDPSTMAFTVEDVPTGVYTGVSFAIGFPDSANVLGRLPAGSPHDGMAWPTEFGGGYYFMRCEGEFSSKGPTGRERYEAPFGRLAAGDSVSGGTFPFAHLESYEVFTDRELEVRIVMNLNRWFGDSLVYDFRDFLPPVEGSPEAQNILYANGAAAFRVQVIRHR